MPTMRVVQTHMTTSFAVNNTFPDIKQGWYGWDEADTNYINVADSEFNEDTGILSIKIKGGADNKLKSFDGATLETQATTEGGTVVWEFTGDLAENLGMASGASGEGDV